MTQEELITYGFKRVIEELQNNEALLEKINTNTLAGTGEAVKANGYLDEIKNSSFLTQMAALEIKKIVKESDDGGEKKSK